MRLSTPGRVERPAATRDGSWLSRGACCVADGKRQRMSDEECEALLDVLAFDAEPVAHWQGWEMWVWEWRAGLLAGLELGKIRAAHGRPVTVL